VAERPGENPAFLFAGMHVSARHAPSALLSPCQTAQPIYIRRMDPNDQLTQYLPVLMLALLAILFSGGMLVGSVVLGKKGKRPAVKDTAYECGMVPIGPGGARLSIKFYLVAMLFILFDIEVVFLYPWAVIYKSMLKENPALILGSMLTFMAILFIGYLYALKKRAFDWKS
jgi:NADH-quinone oxidoreductase subunit A